MDYQEVWRYEEAGGFGPYVGPAFPGCWDMAVSHNDEETHPVPDVLAAAEELRVNRYNTSFYCGVTSEQALDKWFAGWEDTLVANGFRKVRYNVPRNAVSSPDHVGQVLFIKSWAYEYK